MFSLQVVATDSRLLAGAAAVVTVTVVEKNFIPMFTAAASTAPFKEVAENSRGVIEMGSFEVIDTDKNYPLTMKVTGTDPEGYTSSFTVAPKPGSDTVWLLSLNGDDTTLDYERIKGKGAMSGGAPGKLCLDLQAMDTGAATVSYAGHCIQITDVNEPPVVTYMTVGVEENAAFPAVVGEIKVTDPDSKDQRGPGGTPLSFAVKPDGWDAANPCPFALVPVPCTDDAVQTCANITLTKTLNFEQLAALYTTHFDVLRGALTVLFTASDTGGNVVTGTFVVLVADVNEPPTIVVPTAINVPENAGVGAALGT